MYTPRHSSANNYLNKLHESLEALTSRRFEELGIALLSTLLNVDVSLAKSGSQEGADGGTSLSNRKSVRIECKCYKKSSQLVSREIWGEVGESINSYPFLEAWVLMTTVPAPEQIWRTIRDIETKETIAVPCWDWNPLDGGNLGALCIVYRELVQEVTGIETPSPQESLRSNSQKRVNALRQELRSWHIGYELLRRFAAETVRGIWQNPSISKSILNHDVAGGSEGRIHQNRVHLCDDLSRWWREYPKNRSLVALVGPEGVGKTSFVIQWLYDNLDSLPIVLTLPSNCFAVPNFVQGSPFGLAEFEHVISKFIYDRSSYRNEEYWRARIKRLLDSTFESIPPFLVLIDGLSEATTIDWSQLLARMSSNQNVAFIVTTREGRYLEYKQCLSDLYPPCELVTVGGFDRSPKGEFDQVLAKYHISRDELREEIAELAYIPRYFKLTMDLRNQLSDVSYVSKYMLLYEHSRTLNLGGTRGSFTRKEWQHHLRNLAEIFRGDPSDKKIEDWSASWTSLGLSPNEVTRRIDDVVAGAFVQSSPSGQFVLNDSLIVLALGLDLAFTLADLDSRIDVRSELTRWLGDIDGIDIVADVLNSTFQITQIQFPNHHNHLDGEILFAWLSFHNTPESHLQFVIEISRSILSPLFDTLELADKYSNDAAFSVSLIALKEIDSDDRQFQLELRERLIQWFRKIPLEHPRRIRTLNEQSFPPQEDAELLKRIGTSEPGSVRILGRSFEVVQGSDNGSLQRISAFLLQGMKLEEMTDVLLQVCIFHAVRRSPDYLNFCWIVSMNERDPIETASQIRESAMAIGANPGEPHIHPQVSACVASYLFALIGTKEDEERAQNLLPQLNRVIDYERDYLANPIESIYFPIERRHALSVFKDKTIPAIAKVSKMRDFVLDPSFNLPSALLTTLNSTATTFNVSLLDTSLSHSVHDIHYKELCIGLARTDPALLVSLERRRLRSYKVRPVDQRPHCARALRRGLVVIRQSERSSIDVLAASRNEEKMPEDGWSTSALRLGAVQGLKPVMQYLKFLENDQVSITGEEARMLPSLSSEDVDDIIDIIGSGPPSQVMGLLFILSLNPPCLLSERTWNWILTKTRIDTPPAALSAHSSDDVIIQKWAFQVLAISDPFRLGKLLYDSGWSWKPEADEDSSHLGSVALLQACRDVSLSELLLRIAPSSIFEVAIYRDLSRGEFHLLTGTVSSMLLGNSIPIPQPLAEITVDVLRHRNPNEFDVGERTESAQVANPLSRLSKLEELHSTRQEVIDEVIRRTQQCRQGGKHLFQVWCDKNKVNLLCQYDSNVIDLWLEGIECPTEEFTNRLQSAEGFFMALCGILLDRDPKRGVQLWYRLHQYSIVNWVGIGDVPILFHMAFGAKSSDDTDALCKSIMSRNWCHNDRCIESLAILLRIHKRTEWATATIKPFVSIDNWYARFWTYLVPMIHVPELPVLDAWPEGRPRNSLEHARRHASQQALREACSRYWYRAFVLASTFESAYSAWTLYSASATRRDVCWTSEEMSLVPANQLRERKLTHALANATEVNREVLKKSDKLSTTIFGKTVPNMVSRWTENTKTGCRLG